MNCLKLYAENKINGYFPLLTKDNVVYLYHYGSDDDDADDIKGFCVYSKDDFLPRKVHYFEQKIIDEYFYLSYCKASQYAKRKGPSRVELFSIYPVLKYNIFPISNNMIEREIIIIDGDRIYRSKEKSEISNSNIPFIQNGLAKLINNRLLKGLVCVLSKSNNAFDFDLVIPKINPSSLQKGESEIIFRIHCTWKRIYKIASYYCRYGYSAIFWSDSGLLLGHLYKHTSLPIPYDEKETARAIVEAENDWSQMMYDNPFLEHAHFTKPLNQWDYDLL